MSNDKENKEGFEFKNSDNVRMLSFDVSSLFLIIMIDQTIEFGLWENNELLFLSLM